MASTLTPSHSLAALLEQHQHELSHAWAALIQQRTGGLEALMPQQSMLEIAQQGLAALIDALATGSLQILDDYISDVCMWRLRPGYDSGEVVEALLLAKTAALPVLMSATGPSAEDAEAAIARFDSHIHWAIGRFTTHHAEAAAYDLRQQQQRTALILDATQTAASSLQLDEVLARIANKIAEAIGVYDCGIYLLEDEGQRLEPRFPTIGANPSRLKTFLRMPIDLPSNQLIQSAIQLQQPVVSADAQHDARIDKGLAQALGVASVLVLPIAASERTLGVAIAATSGERRAFSDDEVTLAWGIATSGALAVENARLYEKTQRQLAESRSLQRVTAALLAKNSLSEVLDVVCAEACRLTGAAASAILLREDEMWLQVAHSQGCAAAHERIQIGGSITGEVLRQGAPQFLNQPIRELGLAIPGAPVTSLLVAPLRLRDDAIGALDVLNKPGGFSADDMRLLGRVADQAAIAIQNTRLQQQVEQLAIVAERQRLARDLHDSVAQALYSLALYTEAASGALADGEHAVVQEHLAEVGTIAREALGEMRLLIFNLRSPKLDTEGLVAALQGRLDAVEARTALRADLLAEGEDTLPPAVRHELYSIVQEALNNILKHARASHVAVRLRFGPTTRLEISDDGAGFSPVEKANSGLGLRGMRERAARLGGSIDIESAPGQGTCIRVEVHP
ncbi:GAF domain-containing sensor histidine kinase [Chloroflexia bacterium SDU3-3]|nr:GAF domain-containing sensor histidine kinase [Chloroflexia bacterium SDU3-3]